MRLNSNGLVDLYADLKAKNKRETKLNEEMWQYNNDYGKSNSGFYIFNPHEPPVPASSINQRSREVVRTKFFVAIKTSINLQGISGSGSMENRYRLNYGSNKAD